MKRFISVFLSCLMLMSVLSVTASAQVNKVYYLFGYINGANYACEEDYENMGVYRFENGELSARFDTVSYVAVKEENNAAWYMTDGWMGEVKSVKLLNTDITGVNSDKLKVPAGVTVNFTLEENGDDTLTLSYTVDGDENYPIRAELWDYVNIYVNEIILATGNYWTEETEKPFLQALKAANEALDNENASDKELVTAYNNLKEAEKNLKKQDKDYWASKLSALTAEYSMDFEDIEYQYTVYTKESFDNYLSAYRSANSALGNDELFWYELSQKYYELKNARGSLIRLDGNEDHEPDKKLYETDEFKTLLSAYGKEIGIGANVMDESGDALVRTLDGKEVVEYRGIRIFKSDDNFMVFGLSDMLCTVGEEVIGEYRFNNPLFYGVEKNKSGLCVYYNGRIYSIKDAVNEGIITVEKLAEIIPFTEKGEKTYPTIGTTAAAETTSPIIPTNSEIRPTMPVVITDTGSGRYEVDVENSEAETQNTTAKPSTETAAAAEVLPTTEPVETSTETTETEWDGEFVTTEPESTEPSTAAIETKAATEPSETQNITEAESIAPKKPVLKNVKKSNPVKVSAITKTVKAKKLKKSKVTFKALSLKNAKGNASFVKVKSGTTAKIYKKITVNKTTGVITVKKGKYTKKTYNLKVKINVSGNSQYKPKTIYKTVKIKIK